jgi:1,4-alpha-glucan branching enzyme
MGWMHDTLTYLEHDPVHRKHHHGALTFRQLYAFTENFMLPLSHDEVVHLKRSLLEKMPGDDWQKFASLRLLLGAMFAQPGKKLLFMGGEFGQRREWNHDVALQWELLEHPSHRGISRWVRDLNTLYRGESSLHQFDCDARGFEWVDANDAENSVFSFLRKNEHPADDLLIVCNFTPVPRHNYMVGLPRGGTWVEILNSDARLYGGSGQGNLGGVKAAPIPRHGRPYLLNITVPPLGIVMFQHQK